MNFGAGHHALRRFFGGRYALANKMIQKNQYRINKKQAPKERELG